jgi:CubicO group peptidase (beta-lactamase class C family)
MERIDGLMKSGVQEGIFPGGVLLAAKGTNICFCEAYGFSDLFTRTRMRKDTVFDLASLTKPLATTLALMVLAEKSQLTPDQFLAELLPEFSHTDKKDIRIRQLLAHRAGFAPFRPYYFRLAALPVELRKTALREMLIREPPVFQPEEKTVYSDIGFMILDWLIERVSGRRLDKLVESAIYKPLGLIDLFFQSNGNIRKGAFAATELCPWRNILIKGRVHDPIAWAMGGVAGHAGLFGTADAVFRLLLALLEAYHSQTPGKIFAPAWVRRFLSPYENSGRCLGFDRPGLPEPSCGPLFSENTVGHLGFTGTSFWLDLDAWVIVILLTNRIHPTRDNIRIRAFRPRIHTAVMQYIKGYTN